MNFLKISGLVIGTGSVVGGAGAGIYYVTNKNKIHEEKFDSKLDQKIQFVGKLVFEKKSGTENEGNYEMKLLSQEEYNAEVSKLSGAGEGKKYEDINKIVDVSYLLNVENTKTKLKEIFGSESTLQNAKTQVSTEKATELKELFGETIYANLKSKLGI